MDIRKIRDILGDKGNLLDYQTKAVPASSLTLPSPSYLDDVFVGQTDRNPRVLGAHSGRTPGQVTFDAGARP